MSNKQDIYNLPNLVSLVRILMAPVLLGLAIMQQPLWFLGVLIFTVFTDVLDGARLYSGPFGDQVDLVLVPNEGWTVLRRFADLAPIVREQTGLMGTHRPEGILIAAGPDIRSNSSLMEADLIDLVPTLLHLLGGEVPEDMDGRVLTELLQSQRPVIYSHGSATGEAEATAFSADEAQSLEERLKALGYLG